MGELAKRFGKKVRQLRRGQNLTQVQLADATGLSEEWVRRIERGDGSPSFEALETFSKVLGVSVADFFDSAPHPEQQRLAGIVQLTRGLSNEDLAWLEGIIRAALRKDVPRRGAKHRQR